MRNVYFDSATDDFTTISEAFDTEGYVILRNVLSKDMLKRLNQDLEPHFTNRDVCQGLFWGNYTTRIEAILSKSEAAQQVVLNSHIMQLVKHALSANCDNIQLHLTQGIRIHPGERAQIIHPDTAMFPVPKPFEFMVNCIVALSEFTFENGATQVVPGSHLWAEERMPQAHEIMYAQMQPGDILIYTASLLHGGGANIADHDRTGLAISYSLGWLRQAENMYLTYPPHIAKDFSSDLQRLIGYNVHRPNLGWVHGQDPISLLQGEIDALQAAKDFLTSEQENMLRDYYSGEELRVNQCAKEVKAVTIASS